MVSNPFSEGISVEIDAETSGFRDGVSGIIGRLGDFRHAIGITGAALGTFSAVALSNATSHARDFEDSMTDVVRVVDGADFGEVSDMIMDLSNRLPFTNEQLASMAEQAGRLGVPIEFLDEFVEYMGMLAAGSDLSADEISELVVKSMDLIGVPIEQTEEFASAVGEVGNNAAASESEILDVITRAGSAANQFGIAEDEAVGLAGAMNEVFGSSELAGTALRRIVEEMMDPENIETFAEVLGVTPDEFKRMKQEDPTGTLLAIAEASATNAEKGQILRSELGKVGGDFVTLGSNVDDANELMDISNGEFEEANAIHDDFEQKASTTNSRLQVLKNRFRNVSITIGQQFLPAFNLVLDYIIDGIELFQDFNERTNGLVGAFTLVAGVLGGFGIAIAAAISYVGGLTAAAGILTGALAGLGVVFMSVVLPVTVLAAAIAGLWYAWQNNLFGIRDVTHDVFDSVTSAIDSAMSFIESIIGPALMQLTILWVAHKDEITEVVDTAFAVIGEIVGVAMKLLDTLIGDTLDIISSVWAAHNDEIIEDVSTTLTTIVNIVGTFLDWFVPIVQDTLDLVLRFWREHGDDIVTVVSAVFAVISTVIGTTFDVLITLFRSSFTIMSGIVEVFAALLEGDIRGAFDAVVDMTKSFADLWIGLLDRTFGRILDLGDDFNRELLDSIWDLVTGVIDFFRDLKETLVGRSIIPDMFDAILASADDFGRDALGWLGDFVGDFVSDIQGWASDVVGNVDDMASNVLSKLDISSRARSAGRSIGSSLASGIKSKISSVRSAAGRLASAARSRLPGSDADKGPLSDLSSSVEAIPEMLSGALVGGQRDVSHAADRLASAATLSPTRPMAPSGGDTHVHIDTIEASGHREGKEAADALKKELRSGNLPG